MKRFPTIKSDFKKEIKEFIKTGGEIIKLPPEIEWDMFPYFDEAPLIRNKNEKGILDYEESRKPVRGEVLKDE